MAERMRSKVVCLSAQFLTLPLMAMLLASPTLRADVIASDIKYSTTGWISDPFGPPATASTPIGFVGVTDKTVADFRTVDLGNFVITPSPGASTTFEDTPFGIVLLAPQFDRIESWYETPHPPDEDFWIFKESYGRMTVLGHLDGTVSDDGTSDVVATVDEVILGPTSHMPIKLAGLHVNGLPFSESDVSIPQEFDLSAGPGNVRLVGVTAEVVPEPSSALIFLLAGSTWGIWKLRHRTPKTRALLR